jgi:hypothetical protein
MNDPTKMVIAIGFFSTVSITIRSIANIFTVRRQWRYDPALTSASDARLERIETAVDAIAIEVERIAEAQRFTARLAAEREGPRLGGPSGNPGPGRSITPH